MQTGILFQLGIVFFLIIANGLFAMAEMAVVSSRPARLRQLSSAGAWGSKRALQVLEDPNEFLSTVQIGITLIGIVSGAYGGAILSAPLAEQLARIPRLLPHAEILAFAIVVIAITYLSLIIGELVPKRVALQFAERIACLVAPPMHVVSIVFKPFVWFLDTSGDLLLKPFGLQDAPNKPITPDELRAMARQGHAEGALERLELELVDRSLQLADRTVSSVMTPRHLVEWIRTDAERNELKIQVMLSSFSRFPVAGSSLDKPLGLVNARDLLCQLVAGGPINLEKMIKPPLFLPQSVSVLDCISRLRGADCAMALIVDEYGVFQGVVTLEDVLGVLTDDFVEAGNTDPEIKRVTEQEWLADGSMNLLDLQELLGIRSLPVQGNLRYHTVGGMVMDVLQRVPVPEDHFVWERWTFTVREMLGPRIQRVAIRENIAEDTEKKS